MARKSQANSDQFSFDFEDVINKAQVLSRDQVIAQSQPSDIDAGYNPIEQTTEYMQRAVQSEVAWESTIRKAREQLMQIDARQLYLDFLTDLKKEIESGSPKSPRLAELLEQVGVRGLGMTHRHICTTPPGRGGRWRVTNFDRTAIHQHLESHIAGEYFLNVTSASDASWGEQPLLIAASDVSQHRSAVPVPARFFKRSVPFVLNNAAGTRFEVVKDSGHKFENVFNPKPDDTLLRWMLIDPSYQDELEPQDYQRCIASAMDVGQYKFDLDHLLKSDQRTPDIIFRDGSLFPQDAYIDNYVIQNRRSEFTREAIRELLNCLLLARELGVVYCGVAKNIVLKVYSAVTDWFIAKYIDGDWEFGNYTFNDGQAMTLLLSSPDFVGDNLSQAITTCLIRRSFVTRANLNTRLQDLDDLEEWFRIYQTQNPTHDIRHYKRLCEIAHVYMFFVGHSKHPQQQLPRYEFFHAEKMPAPTQLASNILAALSECTLSTDRDHSFMASDPVTYLLPSVTQHAHDLSKQVGKFIDSVTGQLIMAKYQSMLKEGK